MPAAEPAHAVGDTRPRDDADWLATAARVADSVLFPHAMDVDRADLVPRSDLDSLAAKGFYGIAAAPELGGVGLDRFEIIADVVTSLAGGCLASTFVWIQHLGPLITVGTKAGSEIQDRWLQALALGQRRAGIAMAGIRPGAGRIHLTPTPGGFLLRGQTAWVTGWGNIDTLLVGAVDDRDVVYFLLIDAVESATLTVRRTQLAAVQASGTVTVRFGDFFVPADRLARTEPYPEWAGGDAFGSSLNGFLALGVAARCARLLETTAFDDAVAAARTALLIAEPAQVPAARADASVLAHRAATTLLVRTGSRAVLTDQHAQRLYREAGFLLVFGSRPAIKEAILRRLAKT